MSENNEAAIAYLQRKIERARETLDEGKIAMAKDIAEMGVGYAVKWADKYLKLEAQVKAANLTAALISDEKTFAEVGVELNNEALRQMSYLIPGTSDLAERIYHVQALQSWGADCR